jgi:peroxiredoxin/outer membrane lipoprotein-sorting protein
MEKERCPVSAKTLLSIFIFLSASMALLTAGCGRKMNPEDLLNKVKSAYSQVNDFHEASTSETRDMEKNRESTVETEMYFKKPNKLFYETKSGKVSAIAVSDGKDSYLYVSSLNECIKEKAPASISEYYKKTAGMGLVNPTHVVYETFLIDGRLPEKGIASSELQKNKENVGSMPCYIINLTFPTGEKQRLWIGTKDFFIWKNSITINERALRAMLPAGQDAPKKDEKKESRIILVSTETMKVVEANKNLPESRFSYKPPPGVRIVSAFSRRTAEGSRGKLDGKRAPLFSLEDMEGKKVSLDELRGNVVIIDFWDTMCPQCKADLERMEKIHQSYRAKGVVVLGINEEKDIAGKNSFIKARRLNFRNLNDISREASLAYEVDAVPRVVIIDKKGYVCADFLGLQYEEAIVKKLKELGVK